MGLLLSVVISYAGVLEALDCFKHIQAGMLPEEDANFSDLADYYKRLLNRASQPSSSNDWTRECGQGYLCLAEDNEGHLKSAAVKYYDGSQPDSAAILFSTKISSFGQESVDSNCSHADGDSNKRSENLANTTTKTLYANTSESFSVGQRNRSITPSYENISDPTRFSEDSFEHKPDNQRSSSEPHFDQTNKQPWSIGDEQQNVSKLLQEDEKESHPNENPHSDLSDGKEKLKWHYRPLSPVPGSGSPVPEIHFQSSEGLKLDPAYSEDFLRSLDGIKYRPLQRSDPSGRRRSFKKRHSSSSTSSRESRASREEELKMFTSLEEAEFEHVGRDDDTVGYSSTPNLAARSISRSRSRENSKERKNESRSMEAPASIEGAHSDSSESKPRLKDLPKLGSFEEEHAVPDEVTAPSEDVDDFWGNSGD